MTIFELKCKAYLKEKILNLKDSFDILSKSI